MRPNQLDLQVVFIDINLIKPNPTNPRTHSEKQVEQIAKCMDTVENIVPIITDENYIILAGHGRRLAAIKRGYKKVPIIRLTHLNEVQKKAFIVADNKLAENAEWDEKSLAQYFKELKELNFDVTLTGFEIGEIDFTIENALSVGDTKNYDEIPEVQLNPVTKVGDLWQLGNHRIYCGNSLEESSFKILMEEKKAALVFCDPPYNVPISGHVMGNGKIKHREFAMAAGEMSPEEFIFFLITILKHLISFSANGSIHYICMDWRHAKEILAAGECYSELKNICVWVKDNGGMGSFYRSQHELIFVFKNGIAPHKNNFQLGQYGRNRTNCWHYAGVNSFARNSEEGNLLALHPTVKPVQMVADALMDCSDRGDIILDSFLGSGSTLIAADKVERICYGLELDPVYVDTSIVRWQKLTGKKAIHSESGKTFDELKILTEGE